MNNKELQRVYGLLSSELTKADLKIDRIDRILESCNRLNVEYWRDKRAEAVAYLNGIHKSLDIVWKELHK